MQSINKISHILLDIENLPGGLDEVIISEIKVAESLSLRNRQKILEGSHESDKNKLLRNLVAPDILDLESSEDSINLRLAIGIGLTVTVLVVLLDIATLIIILIIVIMVRRRGGPSKNDKTSSDATTTGEAWDGDHRDHDHDHVDDVQGGMLDPKTGHLRCHGGGNAALTRKTVRLLLLGHLKDLAILPKAAAAPSLSSPRPGTVPEVGRPLPRQTFQKRAFSST